MLVRELFPDIQMPEAQHPPTEALSYLPIYLHSAPNFGLDSSLFLSVIYHSEYPLDLSLGHLPCYAASQNIWEYLSSVIEDTSLDHTGSDFPVP
jgi:hypothetical protein